MTDNHDRDPAQVEGDLAATDADAETRREALRRLGKVAAHTAPALLSMLTAADARICSIC